MVANRDTYVKISDMTSYCIADAIRPNPSSQRDFILRCAHPIKACRRIYRWGNISRGNSHAENLASPVAAKTTALQHYGGEEATRCVASVSPGCMHASAYPSTQPANSALCRKMQVRVRFFVGMPQKIGHSQVVDFNDLGKRRNQGLRKAQRAPNPCHSRKKTGLESRKANKNVRKPGHRRHRAGFPSRSNAE